MELSLDLWYYSFFDLILSILFKIEPTHLKILILEFPKCPKFHDQIFITLANVFTLQVNFQFTLGLLKSNGCVPSLNIRQKNYKKAAIYINELILKPFSPFDTKCKKLNLMRKTSGNVFLRHLEGWVFHIFPRLLSIIFVIML